MSASSSEPGWSATQRRLHWWSAALVVAALALALLMTALPTSTLLAKFLAYQLHKSLGVMVFLLVVWRLALRARRRAPLAEPLARLGQGLLYGLLLAVPLLGWLVAQLAPGPVPTTLFLLVPVPHLLAPDPALFTIIRPVHQAAAWLLVGLAAGHAVLGLWHLRRGLPAARRMGLPGR